MDTQYVLETLGTVGSTQGEAKHRFRGTPVLVTAQRQTGGRGRTGREWVHADRAVAASLAFSPRWPVTTWDRLPLVSGLAAAAALGPSVGLKWPNDLLLDDLKVGGLLVESDGDVVIAGFGANLFWPEPVDGATGLMSLDPGPGAPDLVAEQWASGLLDRVRAGPGNWGRNAYRAACTTLGQDITWEPDGSGTAIDIAADGGLVVTTADGEVTLRSGEVSVVRRS